ncbi:MAG: DUF4920 domain-containing protein [Bacteroidetes bacterium]|nr:DUF4920 domain-containing protein [Bacteroidota bacterium]
MKKITLAFIIICCSYLLNAQPPAGKANVGDTYGAKITENGAIAIAELPALLKGKDTVAVKVKAKVVSSCSSKGCWMNLQIDDKNTAFVKMKDYGFFVPTAIANKNVVLEGIAFIKTTSVAELKHYAEDGKKSQAEIDAITEPKQEIRFLANGILVVK